ncbi:MAG: hypothetical protein ACREUC_13335, partial [Steroidobacteraceae bacterium]
VPDAAPATDYSDAAASYTAATSSVGSREAEALTAGYEIAQTWSDLEVPRGLEGYVDIDAQLGNDYLVLARGADGCDVDAVVSDDIKDDSSEADAAVSFNVSAAGTIRVMLPVTSPMENCVIGLGVYRKSTGALVPSD